MTRPHRVTLTLNDEELKAIIMKQTITKSAEQKYLELVYITML